MNTSRQKTCLDDAAPILFRLPNLRTRGNGPNKSTYKSTNISAEAVVEKSSVASNAYYSQATPIPEAVVASPSRFNQLPTPPAELTDTVAHRSAEVVASEPNPTPTTRDFYSAAGPMGRSWMERVGSRIILVVTLLVIVSAAWVTGRRMPGGKPNLSNDNVVQTANPTSDQPAITEMPVPGQAEMNSQPAVERVLAGPLDTAKNDSAQASGTADSLERLQPNRKVEMLSASQPSSNVSPMTSNSTTLLPPSENSSAQASPNEALLGNATELGSMASLEAPLSSVNSPSHQATKLPLGGSSPTAGIMAVPTPSGGEAFYTAEDSSQATPTYPAQTASLQTSTPNAPSIDPNVMVPWADENSPTRSHQLTATPNPITDWSKYLPGSPVDTNIRTTSVVQTPDTTAVQQAAYPQSPPVQ